MTQKEILDGYNILRCLAKRNWEEKRISSIKEFVEWYIFAKWSLEERQEVISFMYGYGLEINGKAYYSDDITATALIEFLTDRIRKHYLI